MNNNKNRENTFRVEFANIPKKPTSEEVHSFVGQQLGVTRVQLVKLQMSHSDDCAFVKVTEHSIAQQVVNTHDNKHDYEVRGVKYKLRIRMADGGVLVRLHDLSENISDEQISRHMSGYGEVLAIQELAWNEKHHFAGLASGIRQVKMVLREHIKSYITIEGETTFVSYPKQRQTCRHCGEYLHTGISCVQNKKLLAQKVSLNDRLRGKSYAGAVRGSSAGFKSGSGISDLSSPIRPETTGPIVRTHTGPTVSAPIVSTHTGPAVSAPSGSSIVDLASTEHFPSLSAEAVTSAPECSIPTTSGLSKASVTTPKSFNGAFSFASPAPLGEDSFVASQNLTLAQVSEAESDQMSTADHDMLENSSSSSENGTEGTIVCNQDGEFVVFPAGQNPGKHKQDEGSISEGATAFTEVKRGRGRPRKI